VSLPPPASSPATPEHVSEGFAWWAPFAAMLIAFGIGGIAFAILGAAFNGDVDAPEVTLGATFVQDAGLVAGMILLVRLSGARVSAAAFGLRRVRPGRVLGMAVLLFLVFYIFLLAWSQLDPGAEDDLATDLGAEDSTAALIAVTVLTTIVAPFVEELFFRGFLFGALRRAMPWWWAAVLAGGIFGLIHLGTPAVFLVPLMVFGALLCVLYQRTGSLIPGMGVHAFNNALALSVSLEWTGGQIAAALVLAPLTGVTLATLIAKE
jgi:uncharacterized protein